VRYNEVAMKLKVTIGLFVLISLLAFCANKSFALDDHSIILTPPTIDLELEAGKISEHSFEIKNTGSKEVSLKFYVTPYSETYGNPDLSTENDSNLLSKWIEIKQVVTTSPEKTQTFLPDEEAENILLKPGGKANVNFIVNTPTDAKTGRQFATILTETELSAENTSSGITNTKRLGVILKAEVLSSVSNNTTVMKSDNNLVLTIIIIALAIIVFGLASVLMYVLFLKRKKKSADSDR
jgi:hypothetical protein